MLTDYKNFNKVLDVLLDKDVFQKMNEKRQHSQFKFSHTLFEQGDRDKIVKWMEKTLGQMFHSIGIEEEEEEASATEDDDGEDYDPTTAGMTIV